MSYDNTNKGSLGKNRNKTSDKHPDYKGKINVNGTEYWLSGWVKETNGDKWVSLSVQEKDQQSANPTQTGFQDVAKGVENDSDLPF